MEVEFIAQSLMLAHAATPGAAALNGNSLSVFAPHINTAAANAHLLAFFFSVAWIIRDSK